MYFVDNFLFKKNIKFK